MTTQQVVDAALARQLMLRFQLGMFDPLEGQIYT
jgi:hypothetical protein